MSKEEYCPKHPDTKIVKQMIMPFMTSKWCPKCQPKLAELYGIKTNESHESEDSVELIKRYRAEDAEQGNEESGSDKQ